MMISTTPPGSATTPTIGGEGMLFFLSIEAWGGPRSMTVAVAARWWWIRRRRPPQAEAYVSDAQAQPKAVVLMEPGEDLEPRDRPRRETAT
jgi:hypothetical protein